MQLPAEQKYIFGIFEQLSKSKSVVSIDDLRAALPDKFGCPMTRDCVHASIQKLVNRGVLTRVGKAKYKVTPEKYRHIETKYRPEIREFDSFFAREWLSKPWRQTSA